MKKACRSDSQSVPQVCVAYSRSSRLEYPPPLQFCAKCKRCVGEMALKPGKSLILGAKLSILRKISKMANFAANFAMQNLQQNLHCKICAKWQILQQNLLCKFCIV